jgi:hypothetical protein
MQMTTATVLAKLEDPATTPGELSAILMFLSADYARKTADFTAVLGKKADAWPRLREARESDKQADKAWDATLEGRLEMSLRLELKSLEKLMSALKSHLRIKETEARNMF